MGQVLGGDRIKCECGELSTTEITLTGQPFPSELPSKETDFEKIMDVVIEVMSPGLEGLRRYTGYRKWDGRLHTPGIVRYWGIMCDSCADGVLEKVSKNKWNVKVQKHEYRWGGLP